MKFDRLKLDQLDKQLQDWTPIKKHPAPNKGWIKLIRSTLGLSSYQLAKKMGVHQSRVMKIEKAEINQTITLKTLKKAAEAMGCKIIYSIVPDTSLHDILEKQARKIAKQRLTRVSHTMELEAQGVDTNKLRQQYEELVKELLEDKPKKLWNEDK